MSSTSCWTCRLRRKGCTGEREACVACKLLNVTCYGYGAKPAWLDGGVKEQAKLQEIKECVKRTTEKQRHPRAMAALKVSRARKEYGKTGSAASDTRGPSESLDLVPAAKAISSTEEAPGGTEQRLPWQDAPEIETLLLMHYLDVVYPLQFPFYKPRIEDGGRGWTLALLMRCPPLYNAALSLAAYHHRLKLPRTGTPRPFPQLPNQPSVGLHCGQEHFYSLALGGLGEHIGSLVKTGQREGLKDGFDILACVTQLIILEVARGGTENWQKHLSAAPDLFPYLRRYLERSTISLSCLNIPTDDVPDNVELSATDRAALEMSCGIIIWVDALGATCTGLRPRYGDACTIGHGDESSLRLHVVMGCRNWVMAVIRETAVLNHWKKDKIQERTFSTRELARRADALDERLDTGLGSLKSKADLTSRGTRPTMSEVNRYDLVIDSITRAFACAAKVYLNVVVSGPKPEVQEIADSVRSTLASLQNLPDLQYLRNAVWPFCIAGCMASKQYRQAFRDLASEAGIHRHIYGTSWKALEVMETCWRLRDEGREMCDWLDAMGELGHSVLLI